MQFLCIWWCDNGTFRKIFTMLCSICQEGFLHFWGYWFGLWWIYSIRIKSFSAGTRNDVPEYFMTCHELESSCCSKMYLYFFSHWKQQLERRHSQSAMYLWMDSTWMVRMRELHETRSFPRCFQNSAFVWTSLKYHWNLSLNLDVFLRKNRVVGQGLPSLYGISWQSSVVHSAHMPGSAYATSSQ